jgi:hypothetical protein
MNGGNRSLGTAVAVAVIVLAPLLAGCATNTPRITQLQWSEPDAQTQVANACGTPTRFPVSQECVTLMGYPYGALFQRKSDLEMAVWRVCATGPCTLVSKETPACQELHT